MNPNAGHMNFNINMNSRMSEYSSNIGGGGNLPQPNSGLYVYRQGSTLTQAGNNTLGAANNSFFANNSGMHSNPRAIGGSVGPMMNSRHPAFASQSQSLNIGARAPGNTGRPQRHTSFKEVWRKAIEKYSPKKSMKLNEVSHRFQIKLEEQQAATNKKGMIGHSGDETAGKSGPKASFRGEEGDMIKFVSMID